MANISKNTEKSNEPVFVKSFEGVAVHNGERLRVTAELRWWDDYFSISSAGYGGPNLDCSLIFGTHYSLISKAIPEIAHMVKYNQMRKTGPEKESYIRDTMFLAGSLDVKGLLKGEKRQAISYYEKLPRWHLRPIDDEGNEIESPLPSTCCKEEKPTKTFKMGFVPVIDIGIGHEPDLEAARSSAVWPEATLEQLRDKEALESRLPALINQFKTDLENLGFVW